MRAGSKAGKGAKTETGIATLGKEPMFTPEDTLNLAYTPDGSYSPAIKDLIEKAPPNLKRSRHSAVGKQEPKTKGTRISWHR